MPNKGTIRGTHHLTFCVGGAQEDYDFHVRLLGLKSVKKTVLFDGEIPIYHLYYGNRVGDASTLLTSFPYRQAGWMGKRGTNQLKSLMLSIPADAIGFWVDRFSEKDIDHEVVTRFGKERVCFAHPCGIPYELVGVDGDTRTPYEAHGVTADVAHPRRVRHDVLGARAGAAGLLHHRGHGRRADRLGGQAPRVPRSAPTRATGASSSSSRSPSSRRARGRSARARSTTTPSTSSTPTTSRWSRTGSSAWASPTSRSPRTAATSSRCTCAAPAARCASWPGPPRPASRSTSPSRSSAPTCASPRTGRTAARRSRSLEPIETDEVVVSGA